MKPIYGLIITKKYKRDFIIIIYVENCNNDNIYIYIFSTRTDKWQNIYYIHTFGGSSPISSKYITIKTFTNKTVLP